MEECVIKWWKNPNVLFQWLLLGEKKKQPTMGFVNWNFTYIMLLHSK